MPSGSATGPFRFVAHLIIIAVLIAAALAFAATRAPWELAVGNLVLRSQQGTTHAFPAPDNATLVTASRRQAPEIDSEAVRPRNVILVIGDGMGVGQVSSVSTILHGPRGGLVMESAPYTGLMSHHAGNLLVTDSAASATALATGFKTTKRTVSVLADGRVPVSIFEAARANGLATGVVTTSGLIDATPAGFTAHQDHRERYAEILDDMLAGSAEVLIGGDWTDHEKAVANSGLQERLGRIDELASAAGYEVVHDETQLNASSGPVMALFPPRASGGSDAHGPPLDELVAFTLDRLSENENGFVLLIESEITDGAGHNNNIADVVDAVRELDEAVATLLAWSEPRGDTLIVVTADHDTGGLGIVGGTYDTGMADVRWATVYHTGQWVPVFAFGPGAEHFTGVIDNTDVPILFAKLLGIVDFPRLHP
ncbi:MAG: alkaline phosphatase [Thermoanaerobaculales bacterium]|jgi:alkaline phosphatase|nr:alkaline phosphatase [Thermoanaerobaculales bacterium]